MHTHHIRKLFQGRIVGNEETKNLVSEVVTKLTPEQVNFVTKNVWFLSSTPDAWAYTFRGQDIPDKYLIFLSDELLSEDKSQIEFTILHELGHVLLGHRNS